MQLHSNEQFLSRRSPVVARSGMVASSQPLANAAGVRVLARSLRCFAGDGADPFYRGEIAERIVEAVRDAGGLLSMDDLAEHETLEVEPIGLEYRRATVFECSPNGHGLAALLALGVLREYEAHTGGGGDGSYIPSAAAASP